MSVKEAEGSTVEMNQCVHLDHWRCSVPLKCEESYTNAIHVPIILLCLQTLTLNQLLGAYVLFAVIIPLNVANLSTE